MFQFNTGRRFGLVSSEVPLISNLDAWHNIALICQYHNNIEEQRAKVLVFQCLNRYGLESIAAKRNASLTEEERFYIMLLRAAMVSQAVIVIDRPFRLISCMKDISFIYEALGKIDDLYTQCYLLDYDWEKKRYGLTDDTQN